VPGTSESTVEGADPTLLRVVPIVRHLAVEGGGTLVLISLELWQDGLSIAWLEAPAVDVLHLQTAPRRWSVEDDIGTAYRPGAGGARGGSTCYRGTVSFLPAPPEAANVLRITPPRVLDGSLSIPLR